MLLLRHLREREREEGGRDRGGRERGKERGREKATKIDKEEARKGVRWR